MKTPQYTALRRYAHSTLPILPAPTLLRDKLIVPDAAHRFVIQHNVYRITHCFVLSKHGLRNVRLRRGRGRRGVNVPYNAGMRGGMQKGTKVKE
jgi:hypothetical protein